MLEEVLANTKLWNANIGNRTGMRISAPDWLNSDWLEERIQELDEFDKVIYQRLEYKAKRSENQNAKTEFKLPILRLKGSRPQKNVLLEAVHAREWPAIEAIFRFVRDWGQENINPKIREHYNITVVPLLSIDQFPRAYGTQNNQAHQDIRFDAIRRELHHSNIVIEVHEGYRAINPMFHPKYLALLAITNTLTGLEYFLRAISPGQKQPKVSSLKTDDIPLQDADFELIYSQQSPCIGTIKSALSTLGITERYVDKPKDMSPAMYFGSRNNKPCYAVELFSDQGCSAEVMFLNSTAGLLYPVTEVTTFVNRLFRSNQIYQSRMRAAENGNAAIKAILEAHLKV